MNELRLGYVPNEYCNENGIQIQLTCPETQSKINHLEYSENAKKSLAYESTNTCTDRSKHLTCGIYSDKCIYVKNDEEKIVAIFTLYVDDIILAADKTVLDHVKKRLESEFEIQDVCLYCLGIKCIRDRFKRTIFLSQEIG